MMQFLPAQAHPLPARVAGRTGRRHRLRRRAIRRHGPCARGSRHRQDCHERRLVIIIHLMCPTGDYWIRQHAWIHLQGPSCRRPFMAAPRNLVPSFSGCRKCSSLQLDKTCCGDTGTSSCRLQQVALHRDPERRAIVAQRAGHPLPAAGVRPCRQRAPEVGAPVSHTPLTVM